MKNFGDYLSLFILLTKTSVVVDLLSTKKTCKVLGAGRNC
jgi:hypothetical protein